MLTRILLILAACGALFAAYMTVRGAHDVQATPPMALPAEAPYAQFVAGAALIEPSSENIAVGTPLPGVVAQVAVQSGDKVKAGDLLFALDDRAAKASLAAAKARAQAAKAQADVADAQVARLEADTRPEVVAVKKASLAVAEAQLADAKDQLATLAAVADQRAVPRQDVDRKRFAVATAQAVVGTARADLALLEANTWTLDLAVAKAQAQSARAQAAAAAADADAARIELERLRVTAPTDAQVMRVNVRPGEFAPVAPALSVSSALLVLGRTDTLHVRVDIDENDAWRVQAGAKARAFARGNRELGAELAFVRIEPLIVPKKSLTGDSTERVDTRVLQAIFSFKPEGKPLYVGQQMDVYIEAK